VTERTPKPKGYRYPELADKEWLRRKHHEEELDAGQIAEELGCSQAGVRSALARYGLYRPRVRRSTRVLIWVSRTRIVQDAKTVTSWWALGRMYGVQPSVVHTHALSLGVHEEVEAALLPRRQPPPVAALPNNPLLQSKDWIAVTWGRRYSMKHVALDALVTSSDLRRWLRVHNMSIVELREARDWAILIEYQAGAVLHQISQWHGVDGAAVWRILRAAGMDTTSRRRALVYTGYEEWTRSTSRT
jgi:hypothetical protein